MPARVVLLRLLTVRLACLAGIDMDVPSPVSAVNTTSTFVDGLLPLSCGVVRVLFEGALSAISSDLMALYISWVNLSYSGQGMMSE